tara:strand:+ start:14 stop:535 length:522 start_codon:yes stop_codon:yes gene_type:complete
MRFAPPKSCMTKTQLRLFNKYNADKKIDFVQKKMAAYCKQGDPKHVCDIVKFKYINTLEAIKIVNQALFIGKSKLRNTLNLLSNSNHLSIKGAFQLLRLKSLIKQDIEIKKAIGLATKLEGLPQKAEPNDSSIVYSHMTLIEQIPLYKADDDVLTSQFTVEDLKKLRFTVLDI